MLDSLTQELQEQFTGEDALATFIKFFEANNLIDDQFNALKEEEKILKVLNRLFSDKSLFASYVEFIGLDNGNHDFSSRSLFLYVCDYFSDITINSVTDILGLPSFRDIYTEMKQSSIPKTFISYAEALSLAYENELTLNSKGEVLYFIDELSTGFLVYSYSTGFHIVDHQGKIMREMKGDDILRESTLDKIRLYKRFLLHFSGRKQNFSREESKLMQKYIQAKIGTEIQKGGTNKRNLRLLELKLRFILSGDIYHLETTFSDHRRNNLNIIG